MQKSGYHITLFTSRPQDLRYAAVLIRSIATHFPSPRQLVFHFLFYDLRPEELTALTKSVEDLPVKMKLYPLEDQVGERRSQAGFGYWAWMWLGRVLPEIDRVLYVDCDMMAYRDIQPLWSTEMDNFVIAAVADPGSRLHNCLGSLREAVDQLNLELAVPSQYINAGLLFINLTRWRQERVLERVEETFSDYQALRFHDQDAINLLLGDRVKLLSPEWNLLESVVLYENWDFELYKDFDPPQDYFEPRLRHFSGNMKPDGENASWRSEVSKSLLVRLRGRLLDFHYVAVRGLKQKAIRKPFARLLHFAWLAPYAPLVYPLLPFFRLIRNRRKPS